MADNLILNINFGDVKQLIESMPVDASEYCILPDHHPFKTVVITTNDGVKFSLIKTYGAEEISDWNFNEKYVKNKASESFTVVGNSLLMNKGY